MPGPTAIAITYLTYTNASPTVISTATVTLSIPAALVALDSTEPGSSQTGYSSADQLIRAIFRAGTWTDGQGHWFPASIITSITAS